MSTAWWSRLSAQIGQVAAQLLSTGDDDAPTAQAPDDTTAEAIDAAARQSAPVIWLVGRTGAGKSSIVATLTGSDAATVGNGFAPCTRHAQVHDFPPDRPLLRFLDTRGLDEAGYDPDEDIAVNQASAHLVLAVVRVNDPAQAALIAVLDRVGRRHPEWPVVVVQTHLHACYRNVGDDHLRPYPFTDHLGVTDLPPQLPDTLAAAMAHQRDSLTARLRQPLRFVAVDFTSADDGFDPPDYGREALVETLAQVAPPIMARLTGARADTQSRAAQVQRRLLYYAGAAAGVGALPLVGVATVPATQSAMLWDLARLYQVRWSREALGALLGMLGATILVKESALLGARQLAKLAPWMIPLAAASDFALTYALGQAACVFLEARSAQREPDAEAVREAFRQALSDAFRLDRNGNASGAPERGSTVSKE